MYNWKVKNAEPGDRVPHKDFWMGLPDLIKVRTHVGLVNVYDIRGSGECVACDIGCADGWVFRLSSTRLLISSYVCSHFC